jgi:hypothetical protein
MIKIVLAYSVLCSISDTIKSCEAPQDRPVKTLVALTVSIPPPNDPLSHAQPVLVPPAPRAPAPPAQESTNPDDQYVFLSHNRHISPAERAQFSQPPPKRPQKSRAELFKILCPSCKDQLFRWLGTAPSLENQVMALVQSYTPATQEFGAGARTQADVSLNDSLLIAACKRFDDDHHPEKKLQLFRYCQEKGIVLPTTLAQQATAAAATMLGIVAPAPPDFTTVYAQDQSDEE